MEKTDGDDEEDSKKERNFSKDRSRVAETSEKDPRFDQEEEDPDE